MRVVVYRDREEDRVFTERKEEYEFSSVSFEGLVLWLLDKLNKGHYTYREEVKYQNGASVDHFEDSRNRYKER